jgi:hypothetical protein
MDVAGGAPQPRPTPVPISRIVHDLEDGLEVFEVTSGDIEYVGSIRRATLDAAVGVELPDGEHLSLEEFASGRGGRDVLIQGRRVTLTCDGPQPPCTGRVSAPCGGPDCPWG